MKIQKLIKENISHDDDWHKFAQNFDVVYENYLKRLAERFPQLNINDQRLCAYLKMGLSSKGCNAVPFCYILGLFLPIYV